MTPTASRKHPPAGALAHQIGKVTVGPCEECDGCGCAACDGTGTLRYRAFRCDECHGAGLRLVANELRPYHPAAAPEYGPEYEITCQECDGDGVRLVSELYAEFGP